MKRLDITALLALVDEKTLRQHIDRNVYFFYSDIYDEWTSGMRFQTERSPLEYLIFNSSDFLQDISLSLPQDEWFTPQEEELIDDVYRQRYEPQSDDPAAQKLYLEAAELIWLHIKDLTLQELCDYLNDSPEPPRVHLCYLGMDRITKDGQIVSPSILTDVDNKGKMIGGKIKIGELTGSKYADALRDASGVVIGERN